MKLPFDVLLAIMAVTSSRSALSAMTATCRMLNRAGAKYLLTDGVTLRSPRQLRSFLLFILAQEVTRIRHFRKLDIHLEHDSPQKTRNDVPPLGSLAQVVAMEIVQDDLCVLLTRPSLSLDTLVSRGAEQATPGSSQRDVHVGGAINRLETLKHLTLLDAYTIFSSAESGLSRLTSATFSMFDSIRCGLTEHFLWHSRDTLRTLTFHSHLSLDKDIHLLLATYIKAFPTLRELSIVGAQDPNHLGISFRLRRHAPVDGREWSLHVAGLPERFNASEAGRVVWDSTKRCRWMNISFQLGLGDRVWPPLAAYTGNIPSLYRLGCPYSAVPHVRAYEGECRNDLRHDHL